MGTNKIRGTLSNDELNALGLQQTAGAPATEGSFEADTTTPIEHGGIRLGETTADVGVAVQTQGLPDSAQGAQPSEPQREARLETSPEVDLNPVEALAPLEPTHYAKDLPTWADEEVALLLGIRPEAKEFLMEALFFAEISWRASLVDLEFRIKHPEGFNPNTAPLVKRLQLARRNIARAQDLIAWIATL